MEKSYWALNKIRLLFLCLLLVGGSAAYAQDFADELGSSAEQESSADVIPGLLTEKIQRISDNKKFFIITNSSQGFAKGDFISLIYKNKLTARALVAKDQDTISGIKILKIYSLDNWSKMAQDLEIQILRGDDSYFLNELKRSQEKDKGKNDGGEQEELTDLTKLEDNLDLEENTNRAIKTDNLLFAYYGFIPGQNADGSSASYSMFAGSWGYQLGDNIWGEATLGQTLVPDYPSGGIDTVLTMFSLKFKYTIEAPFYSYLQPYVGYRMITADSPGAGKDLSGDEQARELQLVEDLKKSGIIFGISFLKRLVPGWFMRADVGTDTMAMGFGLEF